MGFAKAAELKGYANPAHVLEMADVLALTPGQAARTRQRFSTLQLRAKSLGAAVVESERILNAGLANRTVTAESLQESAAEIARLHGKLRATHLDAHLTQVSILTAEQNQRYAQLRGHGNDHSGQKPTH